MLKTPKTLTVAGSGCMSVIGDVLKIVAAAAIVAAVALAHSPHAETFTGI